MHRCCVADALFYNNDIFGMRTTFKNGDWGLGWDSRLPTILDGWGSGWEKKSSTFTLFLQPLHSLIRVVKS